MNPGENSACGYHNADYQRGDSDGSVEIEIDHRDDKYTRGVAARKAFSFFVAWYERFDIVRLIWSRAIYKAPENRQREKRHRRNSYAFYQGCAVSLTVQRHYKKHYNKRRIGEKYCERQECVYEFKQEKKHAVSCEKLRYFVIALFIHGNHRFDSITAIPYSQVNSTLYSSIQYSSSMI